MSRPLLRTVIVLGCLASPLAGRNAPAQSAGTGTSSQRTVYVSAVDGSGRAVADLKPEEFRIKEDGKTRQVLHAEVSTTPLTVALMVDDSGVGLQSMREGAAALITRLRGHGQIALITTGGRNIRIVDYTDSTAALVAGVNKVLARTSPGAFLLDGLMDTAKDFTRREVKRPVIVSIATEAEEYSQAKANDVLSALQESGAQLYLVRLGTPMLGQSNAMLAERGESLADESIRLNAVLGQAPGLTGGRTEQLVQHSGIPRAMDLIASDLLGQYAVTYTIDNASARDLKLSVESARRGVRMRAPARVGGPKLK